MTLHLIDSDGVIDFLNGMRATTALFRQLGEQGNVLCTVDAVIAEVYSGVDVANRPAAEAFLQSLHRLPGGADVARQAGEWRYAYARQGRPLSTADCLVAAAAYIHGAILVTGNLRDFPMPEVSILPLPRTNRRGTSL